MAVITTAEAKCQDCYRCLRSCPLHVIRFTEGCSGTPGTIRAAVMEEMCILDGECVRVCPQGAKQVRNDLDTLKRWMQQGERVHFSVAPSFPGALCEEIDAPSLPRLLRARGSVSVQETALGAEMVAREHLNLLKRGDLPEPQISTSCPAVVNLVEKHYPGVIDHLSPIVSPMVAHARLIKHHHPGDRVVFLGPCLAKKQEADEHPEVDLALTFAEIEAWLKDADARIRPDAREGFDGPRPRTARLFPLDGGLLKTAFGDADVLAPHRLLVTGIEECIDMIRSLEAGEKVDCSFIEMMVCRGGCIAGPGASTDEALHARRGRIIDYVNESPEDREGGAPVVGVDLSRGFDDRRPNQEVPTEEEIREILAGTGKFSPDDELNCGACGFDSCRDKAVAVYRGYADLQMCIPYMRRKAESIFNIVVNALPSVGLIVTDLDLTILETNRAARDIFGAQESSLVNEHLSVLMPVDHFERVRDSRTSLRIRVTREDRGLTTEQVVSFMEEQRLLVGVLIDVTAEEQGKARQMEIRSSAVSEIEQVIDKQMKVVQEIAGLLGETTAETKVQLEELIRVMEDEQ